MSSTIDNYRNLQPTLQNSGLTQSAALMNECLENVKQEFDKALHDRSVLKSQRDYYEGTSQANEFNIIRQELYDLEAQHSRMRQHYEEKLSKLRKEIHEARQLVQITLIPQYPPSLSPPGTGAQPSVPPLQEAHPQPQLTPQLPPRQTESPVPQQQYSGQLEPPRPGDHDQCDRDWEREREKTPDRNLAQRDPPQSTSSQGPPQSQSQAPQDGVAPPYGDCIPENVPTVYKKHGQDWVAVFNPRVPRVLDVNLMHTFSHESGVCCVRFSADGRFLATGCNRTVQIYEIKTGQKRHVFIDESARKSSDLCIRSVCFSPDGKFLATGAEDKQIRIWDIAKNRIRSVFEGHGDEIYSLDFSADGALLVSGSGDRTVRIWPMEGSGSPMVLAIDEPENVDAAVTSVAFSPDDRFVAAGSLDAVVRVWDIATGTLVRRLQGHADSVYSVAFTPDGKRLVSGSLDKTLKLWDVAPPFRNNHVEAVAGAANVENEGGERGSMCLMDHDGHQDYVLSVAVSQDGQWIVSGSKDRGVQFWDARNATVQMTLQGHRNSVVSIDLSPTSGMLATGSGDSQARVWRFMAQG